MLVGMHSIGQQETTLKAVNNCTWLVIKHKSTSKLEPNWVQQAKIYSTPQPSSIWQRAVGSKLELSKKKRICMYSPLDIKEPPCCYFHFFLTVNTGTMIFQLFWLFKMLLKILAHLLSLHRGLALPVCKEWEPGKNISRDEILTHFGSLGDNGEDFRMILIAV